MCIFQNKITQDFVFLKQDFNEQIFFVQCVSGRVGLKQNIKFSTKFEGICKKLAVTMVKTI